MFTFVEDMITRLPSFHFMVSWFHTLWWHFLLPDTVPPKFKVLDTAAHRLWGCFSLIGLTWFQNSIHFWAATGCSSALSRVFKGPSPASFDFLMDAFLLQTGKLPSSGPLASISCSRPGNRSAPNFSHSDYLCPMRSFLLAECKTKSSVVLYVSTV